MNNSKKIKIAAISAIVLATLTLSTSCSTPAFGQTKVSVSIQKNNAPKVYSQKEIKTLTTLYKNNIKIKRNVRNLYKHVGRTWYVFAGSTPRGWDCSGLVKWFYGNLGVSLPHSASAQRYTGKRVKSSQALPGDIVTLSWNKNGSAGHSGIYIGNGKMIHSPSRGYRTRVDYIKNFMYGYRYVSYTRPIKNSDKIDLAAVKASSFEVLLESLR